MLFRDKDAEEDEAHLGDDEISGADKSGEVHETQGGQQAEPPHRHLVHEGVKKLGTACQHAHRVNDQLQHTHKVGQLTYWLVYIWHAEKPAAMHLASAGTSYQAWMQQEHDERMLFVSMQQTSNTGVP